MTATYPLLEAGDVLAYLRRSGLDRLLGDGPAEVRDVTGGNMNRVFVARAGGRGVAVKQAPPWVQVAGPDWPASPERIASEARAYRYLTDLVPDVVPVVHAFDAPAYTLVMEDLSDLRVLRDVFVDRVGEPGAAELGAAVGRFVGELTFATGDLGLTTTQRTELTAAAVNPDLCRLTLDVLLDEPYRPHEHNRFDPALRPDVEAMYANDELRAAVAELRYVFSTRAEALIHGDLHSGSVMVGRRDGADVVKVFDPEFSFVGPIGFDLGLWWANLAIAAAAAHAVGLDAVGAARQSGVAASWAAFERVWRTRWPSRADPAYPDGYLDHWLARIRREAVGFAGIEAVRRVAGYSHAADLTTLPDGVRAATQRRVLAAAVGWITDPIDLPAVGLETP
ncbi:S-methyl-5-thioribose kinase [Jiangella endophytica]|uniref:S-methyl-5-thioribose kinase n=1 Tax=Jiangella endophytica TaxID=1623398 RepID=UPI000E3408F2|nr:S-methyl-5-thioribose kinase [Jiangella endophytica]